MNGKEERSKIYDVKASDIELHAYYGDHIEINKITVDEYILSRINMILSLTDNNFISVELDNNKFKYFNLNHVF